MKCQHVRSILHPDVAFRGSLDAELQISRRGTHAPSFRTKHPSWIVNISGPFYIWMWHSEAPWTHNFRLVEELPMQFRTKCPSWSVNMSGPFYIWTWRSEAPWTQNFRLVEEEPTRHHFELSTRHELSTCQVHFASGCGIQRLPGHRTSD